MPNSAKTRRESRNLRGLRGAAHLNMASPVLPTEPTIEDRINDLELGQLRLAQQIIDRMNASDGIWSILADLRHRIEYVEQRIMAIYEFTRQLQDMMRQMAYGANAVLRNLMELDEVD